MASIAGVIFNDAGVPAVGRVVRAYRRDTGEILGSAVSGFDTVLYLHFDGADNATTTTDSGPLAESLAVFGSAKISVAQKKAGVSSAFFDTTASWIAGGTAANYGFSTSDFFVEFSLYPMSNTSRVIAANRSESQYGWRIYLNSIGKCVYESFTTAGLVSLESPSAISASVFTTVRVMRINGVSYMLIGGTVVASITDTSDVPTTNTIIIGWQHTGAGIPSFYGYMDEFMVGKARSAAGGYSISTSYVEEAQVIVQDDAAGTLYNDLIIRVIPA